MAEAGQIPRNIQVQCRADHRVALAVCESYEPNLIRRALERILEPLGGWEALLPQAPARILVKPNLLAEFPPERQVTTHPAVLRAVLEALLESGRRVLVGDSPAGSSRVLERVWRISGLGAVCDELGVEIVGFETAGHVHFRGRNRFGEAVQIARPVVEADAVVNLPKLKTHSLTLLTCAVKNLYGYVPGMRKTQFHRLAVNPLDFGEIVADCYAARPPALSIVDAVTAMQGDGPASGAPYAFGRLAAGANAAALDHVLAGLIGLRAAELPVERACRRWGLFDPRRISVIGDATPVKGDFSIPATAWRMKLPSSLSRYLAGLVRLYPGIDAAVCVRCGACARACPNGAVSRRDGAYRIDYGRCILCLCCHEVCPVRAVELTGNLPVRLWRGLKRLKRRLFAKDDKGRQDRETKRGVV
jgi:uncharacterized protein (DUF362 family)